MSYESPSMLYYLDILLKHGNYTKAAKDLYISQPYLTQLIQRKEKELNIQIIDRHSSPLQLTDAGRLYYQHLYTLEAEQDKFQKKIALYTSNEQTIIRVGILSSLGTYLLPLFLPNFLKKHPEVNIELHEDTPDRNDRRILNGNLDFFIGQNPETISPNLKVHDFGKHGYFAIIPKTSSLFVKGKKILETQDLSLRDILNEKLILTTRGSAIRKQVDYLINKNKIQPEIILESSNIFTIVELATKGLGITFLPESVKIHNITDEFNIYPLPKDLVSLDYFIAYPAFKTLISAEKDFIDTFLKYLKADFK